MNAPILPESAPFSVQQRQWLNGYLAGLTQVHTSALNFSPQARNEQPITTQFNDFDNSTEVIPVTLLFGSQSGNAEGLAHDLAGKLKRATEIQSPGRGSQANPLRIEPKVMGLEQFAEVDWSGVGPVLILTSTWGDGEMPYNATGFWEWLNGPKSPTLSELNYAILGLGDRNYARFCQAGKNLDTRLAELGANRMLTLCECDTDFEVTAATWMEEVIRALLKLPAPLPPGNTLSAAAVTPSAAPQTYDRKHPFPAPLLENHPLNAKGSEKDTRHLVLSLLGSGLDYRVGDALGVQPRNCYELVDRIILGLNCLGNEKVTLNHGETFPLRSALLSQLDIGRVPPTLLGNLRQACSNRNEQAILDGLLAGTDIELREYLDGKDLLDVLEDFPHTRLDAQSLVESLGKLAPRLYSISSSPKEHPGEVHITVGIVRYAQGARLRRGVASAYLAERVPLGMPVSVYIQPSAHFTIPERPGTPIIMVGPGTGIAPFRAFLEERRALGDPGKNWLFFGDQRRKYDFPYGEELIAWHSDGFLTRLDLAFSRDQEEKIYVQHRILEQAEEVWLWLEQGAHFYICGDAKRMAKDVEQSLLAVISEKGGKNSDEAKEYLAAMQSQKRYQRDVY